MQVQKGTNQQSQMRYYWSVSNCALQLNKEPFIGQKMQFHGKKYIYK